jgi:hypothetical protein
LAAFKSRDPFPHVGAFSPAALAYVTFLEARIASHTRSTE